MASRRFSARRSSHCSKAPIPASGRRNIADLHRRAIGTDATTSARRRSIDVAHELKEAPDTSVRDLSAVLRNYQSKEQRADYVDYCSDRVERMIDALTALGEAAPGTPILVIDQAEEVFTLRDTGDRSVSRGRNRLAFLPMTASTP